MKTKHQTDWKTNRLRHPPWISLQACQAYTGDSRARLQGKWTTGEKRLGMGNQEQKQRTQRRVHASAHPNEFLDVPIFNGRDKFPL